VRAHEAVLDQVAGFVAAAWDAAKLEKAELKAVGAAHADLDLSQFLACVRACKASGAAFSDLAFPPAPPSLCFDWSVADVPNNDGITPLWKALQWKRSEAGRLFIDGVEPGDIQQGELGDCYLLSALSALAELPRAVEALFPADKQCPEEGIYVVRLCICGHWREVMVDDRLPCFPPEDGGKHVFSRSRGGELWVLLIEKAWAKVHGSYQAIISGLAGEALTNLTGAPCDYLHSTNPKFFQKIYDATTEDSAHASKGWYVVALLPNEALEALEEVGLVAGHSYAVLDARQLQLGGATTQLLQLRNPWGSAQWHGAFSPGAAEWTPEARAQLGASTPGVDDSEGGCFWLTVADFARFFAGVQVCRASQGWHHESEDVHLRSRGVAVLTLTLKGDAPADVDLSLLQRDLRMHHGTPGFSAALFQYLGVRFFVVDAHSCAIVAHCQLQAQRDVWVECKALPPGQYWILVESDWDGTSRLDEQNGAVALGVSARSAAHLDLLAPRHCQEVDGAAIKQAALTRMCQLASGADVTRFDALFPAAARKQAGAISKRHVALEGTYAWLYENDTRKLRLTERLPLALDNMGVLGADESADAASVVVGPGEARLLVLEQRKAGPFSWSLRTEAPLAAEAMLEEVFTSF